MLYFIIIIITPHIRTTWRYPGEHIGKYDTLLEIVKRKLRWFGHVVRVKGTLANNILQGKVEGKNHGEGQKEWIGLRLNEMWREPEDWWLICCKCAIR